ncbi:hypothetical protein [Bremerella sp.]|uniref:hypothetical protein n=1 Tax=Bremerella sp. TaxID=2795602 RepID=UPI00391A0006
MAVATSHATAVQHVGDHQSDRPEYEAGYEASRTGILFIPDRETSGTVDASKNQADKQNDFHRATSQAVNGYSGDDAVVTQPERDATKSTHHGHAFQNIGKGL